jgi:AcrR family transcriptional regulator
MKDAYHHGDLRQALLDAAVALIAEHGVHGLSLREAARIVGVSHAAPYRHFADKNAMLIAIAQQGFAWLAEAGEAAMVGIDDPRQRLNAYGVAYVRFAVAHPVHFRVMFTEELSGDEASARAGSRSFQLLVDASSAVVGPGHDPELSAVAAWSWPHGLANLILTRRIPPEAVDTPEKVEALARRVIAQLDGALGPNDP